MKQLLDHETLSRRSFVVDFSHQFRVLGMTPYPLYALHDKVLGRFPFPNRSISRCMAISDAIDYEKRSADAKLPSDS